MRQFIVIFAWIFLSLNLVACSEKILKRNPQCFIEGRCIQSHHVDVQTAKNEIDCLEICKSNLNCKWFSFRLENNFCELLDNCTQLEETKFFVSGSADCKIPSCWIQGECLGTVLHSEITNNKRECLDLCKSNLECNWFTFYETYSECELYGDCPTIDETCTRCISGEYICREEEEKPLGFTKLLVGTGYNEGGLDSVEVVDLSSSSSSCKQLPNYPIKTFFSFGGLFNNTNPIICGGISNETINKCHTLNQNSWMQAQSMSVPRYGASLTSYPSAMATSENDLLAIGGYSSSGYLSLLEVFSHSGWSLINSQLLEGIVYACAITVNDTHVLITGGSTDSLSNGTSGTIWFDTVNENFSSGPTMKSVRYRHGCGKMKSMDANEVYIIVAGGYDGSSPLDSTEILELGSDEWKLGPKLPSIIAETTMVEDKLSNSVLLVGGYDEGSSNKIFKLASPLTATSQWEELPQKLSVGNQAQPVAFFIPDSFVDCHEEKQPKET